MGLIVSHVEFVDQAGLYQRLQTTTAAISTTCYCCCFIILYDYLLKF